MKKLLSALLTLTICLSLYVPAMAADGNYFEENGLTVSQTTPSSLQYTYLLYNADNTNQYVHPEGQFKVLQCTTEPSTEAGYNIVTLKFKLFFQVRYFADGGIEMLDCIWMHDVYDYYTGKVFSVKNMPVNGGSYDYVIDMPVNGRTASIYYSEESSWEQGEWYRDGYGDGYCDFSCSETCIFKVPADYDGLVFALVPVTEKPDEVNFESSEGESYVKENIDSEKLSGTQFFRFGEATPTVGGFFDVAEGTYYADPVLWAVENSVTTGTAAATFSPKDTCTRAQVITFLYRAAGEPEISETSNITDVASDKYYYNAVQWAAENDMFSGTEFKPNDPCTRAMAVDFMWKYAKKPVICSDTELPFTDVSSSDEAAVTWALESGVTTGTSETTFSPDDTCTRGQIVTFLYRAFA